MDVSLHIFTKITQVYYKYKVALCKAGTLSENINIITTESSPMKEKFIFCTHFAKYKM
jgi:hypothetical protein